MYRRAYAEIVAEDPTEGRRAEVAAFDHVIAALEMAHVSAPGSEETRVALDDTDKLWMVLLSDLAHPDNALPDALRARLISIGLWVMREVARLRTTLSADLNALIEVNASIRTGLR